MENERRWLSFELDSVGRQRRIHQKLPEGYSSRSAEVQSWRPYEAERWNWTAQKVMTGLVNLMARTEPVFEYRQGLSFVTKQEIMGGDCVWFDEAADISYLGWDLASEASWSVHYWMTHMEELRLYNAKLFRSMHL